MRRSSDQTKAVILAAAKEQFAAGGFDGATIRSIAIAADIDPSMVMRYFGTKDQLFAAAAEFDLRFPDVSQVPVGELGAVLVGHFLDRWESDDALTVLLRSATTNTVAAQRMQEIFSAQLGPAVAAIAPGDAPRRAGLIASQMLGMALCRLVLQLPPMVELTREEMIDWLGPTIQRYLTGSPILR
ncbi:TetR/AcrR family transcriptional regulator [Mycolicibacterium komossense]|uniref:TetR/AcrR family transcriptional regulator n=1 Tax=Mycolicibacterium komossense TaxID=1779 RepID=A0ABT3CDT8_9MYCO|nr:TetR family transcriptional regulator [Mycolicibacterium komossense]MCV7227654.1 TetR/AcrR family transcriptional regulator [Mycolicibacterium komossense]